MPLGIENSQVSAWEFCFVERGVQPKWLVSATLNDHELERVKKLRSLSVAETDNAARPPVTETKSCASFNPENPVQTSGSFRLRSTTI